MKQLMEEQFHCLKRRINCRIPEAHIKSILQIYLSSIIKMNSTQKGKINILLCKIEVIVKKKRKTMKNNIIQQVIKTLKFTNYYKKLKPKISTLIFML